MLRQEYYLADMVGVMRELAIDRFDHRERLASNSDRLGHVLRGEAMERGEKTLPSRLPAFDQNLFGIVLGRRELAVPIAASRVLSCGGKTSPPCVHAAGHVLQEYGDVVGFFVEGSEEVRIVDLCQSPFGQSF